MSLLHSLLLDPHRLDVWMALRIDRVSGTGTESDPYDVSSRAESPISITTLTYSVREATVTTSTPHDYNDSDVVVIAGVTGSGAAQFNGRFSIYGKTESTFKYAMLQTPADSAGVTNATCTRVTFPIDQLLYEKAGENTTVHLGPGVIETRGWSQGYGGRYARSGQKIIGSGIDVTILKIVHGFKAEIATTDAPVNYYAIGTPDRTDDISDFEASDFTVDCNLGGQPVVADPSYFSPVLCGAIKVGGPRNRIRRVRAINWGTQNTKFENFVLFLGLPSPEQPQEVVDCVIEDCVLDQPSMNAAQLVSCVGVHVFIGNTPNTQAVAVFHRGCVVRNCAVDCRYKANPVAISRITYSGTTATVTTAAPHGRANSDWVRIAGAYANGSAVNPFNGSFQITNATSTTFQYTMPSTPAAPPVGDLWVDRFPSHAVGIASITLIDDPTHLYEITTYTPHYRIPNDSVAPRTIKVSGAVSIVYNGLFKVESVGSPTKFQYKLLTAPEAYPPDVSVAAIGWEYHALSSDGGTATVEEGNQVYGALFGHYNDTASTKDITIRNNYFHDVVHGVYYNMGSVGPATSIPTGKQITYNSTTDIATFTTPVGHGLLPKSAVQISGATVGGNPTNPYNGFYEVLDVPPAPTDANGKPTTFTYQLGTDPGSNADSNTGQYAEYWRVRRLVVENNVVELTPTLSGTGGRYGIILADYPNRSSVNIYLQSVLRGNVIREVNDAPDTSSFGIGLAKCESAVTEQNVIDPAVGTAIVQNVSGVLEYFDNETPAGSLLQGYDQQRSRKVDELTTKVEDSLLVSMF